MYYSNKRMKIITVSHQKGGVGKTTLTLNLALYFAGTGLKVGVVDTDSQGSLNDVREIVEGIDFLSADALQNGQLAGYEMIFVDTPPYLQSGLVSLFEISDFVLIPSMAGYLDAMAAKSTVALIEQAQAKKTDLKAGIVLNNVPAQSRNAVLAEVKELLSGMSVPLLTTIVHQRNAFKRSIFTSGIDHQQEGRDEKAVSEIDQLATEIVDLL
jgi:chromosome partitioning protein